MMEEMKRKLKVYCETSFWSYLTGRPSVVQKTAYWQSLPEDEVADAYHIATAAVHCMDVLLTWNCKHMANRFALPRTISVVNTAGYDCPAIVTPEDFLKEELE